MEVTEIRVKLVENRDEKLCAYCSVTFDDCFVVRDLKIIRGNRGLFVAMPSRKLADLCPACRAKNHLRARFCNECGHALAPDRAERDGEGRAKLHADVAHPIHTAFREELQLQVIAAYEEEAQRADEPGYQPRHTDLLDTDDDAGEPEPPPAPPAEPVEPIEPPQDPPPSEPEPDPAEDKPDRRNFGEGILP